LSHQDKQFINKGDLFPPTTATNDPARHNVIWKETTMTKTDGMCDFCQEHGTKLINCQQTVTDVTNMEQWMKNLPQDPNGYRVITKVVKSNVRHYNFDRD